MFCYLVQELNCSLIIVEHIGVRREDAAEHVELALLLRKPFVKPELVLVGFCLHLCVTELICRLDVGIKRDHHNDDRDGDDKEAEAVVDPELVDREKASCLALLGAEDALVGDDLTELFAEALACFADPCEFRLDVCIRSGVCAA